MQMSRSCLLTLWRTTIHSNVIDQPEGQPARWCCLVLWKANLLGQPNPKWKSWGTLESDRQPSETLIHAPQTLPWWWWWWGTMHIYSNGVWGSVVFVNLLLGAPPSSRSWGTCNKQNPVLPELMESGGKRPTTTKQAECPALETKTPRAKGKERRGKRGGM